MYKFSRTGNSSSMQCSVWPLDWGTQVQIFPQSLIFFGGNFSQSLSLPYKFLPQHVYLLTLFKSCRSPQWDCWADLLHNDPVKQAWLVSWQAFLAEWRFELEYLKSNTLTSRTPWHKSVYMCKYISFTLKDCFWHREITFAQQMSGLFRFSP